MEIFKKREIVKAKVEQYFLENADYFINNKDVVNWEKEHIVNTGTQVMCKHWNISQNCGGFVDAVVANDLHKATGSADYVNQYALRFYCAMIYNLGIPSELVTSSSKVS